MSNPVALFKRLPVRKLSPQYSSRLGMFLAGCLLTLPAWAQQATPDKPVQLEGIEVKSTRLPGGPDVSPTGGNSYSFSAQDIANLPTGSTTPITDVLTQMPGVAIDQNQQIHIRNTEGPQFQYSINGIMVPLDINTNPPFLSMINPMFIKQLDLQDGILPSRYSYATGGVIDIQTKDGCETPGGSMSVTVGQRDMLQPSIQYGGCNGRLSYFLSGLYEQGNTAFSSATPGANAVHNWTNQGQGFGLFSYKLSDTSSVSLLLSSAASNNQLPNVPGLPPAFDLAGAAGHDSANINSYLNFRDTLAMVTLKTSPSPDVSYQFGYSAHRIEQVFKPDVAGELIFQGVASNASHTDIDNTLQGDATWRRGDHTLGTGFYLGSYRVTANDSSMVFPANDDGNQLSNVPVQVINNSQANNVLKGVYISDLWKVTDRFSAYGGIRWDGLTGFTNSHQVDPSVNLSYLLGADTTLHGGFARYIQVPSLLGISPTAQAAFEGTTAAGPPGIATPLTEDDREWDIGVVHHLTSNITIKQDNFYEITHHYLDTGQFGVVPIFAPFNYDHGYIWGSEIAIAYHKDNLSAYLNGTFGRNMQEGVATGQFNFDPDELAYINTHHIVLDHQPYQGYSAGMTYDWKPWSFSLSGTYSSGLHVGFADTLPLPAIWQVNASIQRSFRLPGGKEIINRLTLLNIFDRENLIRPSEGIGIFQSAYGPRFTVADTLTISF
jgi:hypothetical protein